MAQCEECGTDTINPATIINDEMRKLCKECTREVVEAPEMLVSQSEGGDNSNHSEENEGSHEQSRDTENGEKLKPGKEWRVQSIRNDWNALNVRLPDTLMRRFNAYHKRLDYELVPKEIEFGKDRHYKPLVIALGLKAIKEMDADDAERAVELLEANQIVE
jgi:hypothetical protein